MPNWCECELEVIGKYAAEFIDWISWGDSAFDFATIIPEPSYTGYDSSTIGEDGKMPDWYNWRLKNWGTKWNASNAELDGSRDLIRFETAWSPPIPVILRASEMFDNTKFILSYWESGMGFCGHFVAENGKVIHEMVDENYQGIRGG